MHCQLPPFLSKDRCGIAAGEPCCANVRSDAGTRHQIWVEVFAFGGPIPALKSSGDEVLAFGGPIPALKSSGDFDLSTMA